MPRMISRKVEQEIHRLLQEGLKYRAIVKRLGVSLGTVSNIRQLPTIRPRHFIPKIKRLKKARRCPMCGELLKEWPCLLCYPEARNYDEPEIGGIDGEKKES